MRTLCKVCNSSNLNEYESIYLKRKGRVTDVFFQKLATKKGEKIGRKCFKNHFEMHYRPERIQEVLSKGRIDSQVEESKAQAINILDEIRENLKGLKNLIEATKDSTNLSDVVSVYREHRLTLQDIERLRNKLSSDASLSKAELYREIYWACTQLCPKCKDNFWVKLDERLRRKGFT